MNNRQYPIIIGHLENGESDKCIIAAREDTRVKVLLCRLKDSAERHSGDEVKAEEIQGVISEIWFCRKESLKAFIGVLQRMMDGWDNSTKETIRKEETL